eukprot:CAMPEP_0206246116 /NCGR_PEP_ID=MMETSP0047_2-20121206/19074_1 /ASSEMBLY_ACC=CAM_ASM_000192 /TAXON_ID=195065 /ORGANISM="Chroomonas mesostigmatica_cf, Strain CCMP1168" /LENGTH=155 /DNA_ID=CAMNT_0053671491 /DNA_START=186 /DNA_END=649 /DNA_ORIENTATION=+
MEVSKGSMPGIHNKRDGDMSGEELAQCLLDMETWLSTNAADLADPFLKAAGASPEELAKLPDGSPEVLKGLLAKHNGHLPVLDFVLFSCSEVAEACASNKASDKWKEGTVPLGKNPDGDLLVVCASGVHRWDPELGLGMVESESLSTYLEKYRDL